VAVRPGAAARARCWLGALALFAGCATVEEPSRPALRPSEARALIAGLLPASTADRAGWATDIHAALTALDIPPTRENICAVIAITEQESSFRVDPTVPNLSAITWKAIEERAERAGVPMLVVRTTLQLNSPTGRSYAERIDAARTEQELSRIFEDFVGMVPLGRTLFANLNPVRTGGPMQVSIAWAERHARERTYPYPMEHGIRHEVFTRRGGVYFGIAHLLDYPASYDRPLYRFADFNAGHYASRNAAFQQALDLVSGIELDLDGDLVRHDGDADASPGATERAARVLAQRLKLDFGDIRSALERGDSPAFERTALYQRVFAMADRMEGRPLPRAVVPRIALKSPKITRKLTTSWFATRVDQRHQRCMARD
jgi:hypothetical protein